MEEQLAARRTGDPTRARQHLEEAIRLLDTEADPSLDSRTRVLLRQSAQSLLTAPG